jgi:hypothetical protein
MDIFVDYSKVGLVTRFSAPVFRHELEQLAVGDQVTVIGDDVEPREAVVTAIDSVGGQVSVELIAPGKTDSSENPTSVTHNTERELLLLSEIADAGVELDRHTLKDVPTAATEDETRAIYREESTYRVDLHP